MSFNQRRSGSVGVTCTEKRFLITFTSVTYSSSTMEIPAWLTKDYIEEALRIYHQDNTLKITDLQIKSALGKGENFGGILTRAKVQYSQEKGKQTHTKHFIVKTSYEEDAFAKEKMQPYDIFNREMSIYEQVLPQLENLLHEIEDDETLFAKAISIDYKRQALIFEDLSVSGYVMADRVKRLDLKHVQLILRKLAKMHATSAVLNERQDNCLEVYDRGFFNRYTNNYSPYFVGNLLACGKYVQQAKCEKLTRYAEKLFALEPRYMEIGKRCFEPTPDHVNVLAHGDVWTNNVMFKYDPVTKDPIDVFIIDFQYSFWGSPALDLHHFFNTSLVEDLRLNEQDMLVQYYHSFFAETLRKLKYQTHPVPSLHTFCLHVEEKRFFAFHSSCIVQPVMINEDTKDADFNALMAEDERALNFKNKLYTNKIVQKNLEILLPIFDQRGLLDANQCD